MLNKVKEYFSKLQERQINIFLFGCFYGAVLFIFLYGTKILNVTYDDWLLEGGDISQHYIGWMAYRASDWKFPIGLLTGLNYPDMSSIVYTDSIPHFALLFKLLSPMLPETFQYFGLFGICSFALMGGFSTILIFHYLEDLSLCVLCSTFFIYSPYVLQRMYGHTALASQWVLIAALYLWLCYSQKHGFKKKLLMWTILAFCVSGIHIYFVPMFCIFLLMNCINDFLLKEKGYKVILELLIPIMTILMTLFLYGGFYGSTALAGEGLGAYSSNLNAFFDPQGYSLFLNDLAHGTGQNEGFGYLGLGIILICIISIVIKVLKKHHLEKIDRVQVRLLAFAFVIFVVVAVSPVVMLGENVLFSYSLPAIIIQIWSIFRASGRFIWGACYILMFYCIIFFFDFFKDRKKCSVGFGVLLVAIQVLDLSPSLKQIHVTEKYQRYVEHDFAVDETVWNQLLTEYKYIIFQPYDVFDYYNGGADLAYFALSHRDKLSTFYLARNDVVELEAFNEEIASELQAQNSREDVVYVFAKDNSELSSYNLNYYDVDNWIIGLSKPEENLVELVVQ